MGAGMSANNLPYGAREILALRSTGKRPADMLLISLIGPLHGETNPTVVANPLKSYDWRFLHGLDVLIVATTSVSPEAIRRILDALKAVAVDYLGLWLADKQNGRHLIVGGVPARPRGVLRFMDHQDRQRFAGLGLREAACA